MKKTLTCQLWSPAGAQLNVEEYDRSQKTIFGLLDNFCAARNDPVRNSGEIRYISGPSRPEKAFLQNARYKLKIEFTGARKAALYEHEEKSYFCLVGFENSEEFSTLAEESVNGGRFTAITADLKPKPKASTTEIRNIVEAQDGSMGSTYAGHAKDSIALLFPRVRIFSNSLVSDDDAFRIIFRFCLLECRFDDFWISENLAQDLIELCDVDSLKIPYQTLCRSIFDADPAALFLALYRCVEALYAVKTADRLVKELDVEISWNDMCVILERRLGWRPPEASSLNILLELGDQEALERLLEAINVPDIVMGQSLASTAGKQIYSLRNALVHFRPIHHATEYQNVDWNNLCGAMASLVRNIYEQIFLLESNGHLE